MEKGKIWLIQRKMMMIMMMMMMMMEPKRMHNNRAQKDNDHNKLSVGDTDGHVLSIVWKETRLLFCFDGMLCMTMCFNY